MYSNPRVICCIAAVVLAGRISGVHAAEPPMRTIEVSASGGILVEPDEVLFVLTAYTRNKELLPAKSANDRLTRNVLKLREKYGLSQEQFQIDTFRIRPEYKRVTESTDMELIGYGVHRSIRITLTDFTTVEPLLSDALAAGITQLDEFLYRTTKHREYQVEARRLAVDIAKEKAGHLAEMNGLKLGKPITIAHSLEGDVHTGRMYNRFRRAADDDGPIKVHLASMASTKPKTPQPANKAASELQPIAPGLLSIQCTVTINFEMIE